ncbi:MAG TPA: hypothetical protein VGO67_10830 [Verrucomicrobiae bacterium]
MSTLKTAHFHRTEQDKMSGKASQTASITGFAGVIRVNEVETSEAKRYAHAVINARVLKERMDAQPFKPFRICLTDGKSFNITNHDIAFVKSSTIEIGIELDAQGFAEYCAECALIHITHIEDIPAGKAA